MKFLKKLQALPEPQRKIIFWLAIIVLAGLLLFFWTKRAKQKLEEFEKTEIEKEIQLPPLEFKMPETELRLEEIEIE